MSKFDIPEVNVVYRNTLNCLLTCLAFLKRIHLLVFWLQFKVKMSFVIEYLQKGDTNVL